MNRLEEYRRKRDFSRTKEPPGAASVESDAEEPAGVFVVHKHAARRLHYDLRLENDGVLESWAVPKEPSMKVGEKRLAVHVEDHPLDYGDFEGTIPKKEYGGGTVMLWDRGTWRQKERKDGRIDFELEGHKLKGAWSLTRLGREGKQDNWLLIKRTDRNSTMSRLREVPKNLSVATGRTMQQIASDAPPAERSIEAWTDEAAAVPGSRKRSLPSRSPAAQLATLVDRVPEGAKWLQEIKFDGYRILAVLREGEVTLWSRNGKDWTGRFPAIAARLSGLPAGAALLDGEVVALEPSGLSSFRRLQEMLSAERTQDAVYQVFDLLHLDGIDLHGAALLDRKELLARVLGVAGLGQSENVRYTGHVRGQAREFFANACDLGLEGIICKRADARYRAVRNRDWLKVKCVRHEELLIGGYTDPGGSRAGFGALLLGAPVAGGELEYAGKVGTGFSDRQLRELHGMLRKIERDRCPFRTCPERRGVHWVEPELVAEVAFTEWTGDGRLRHPVFRGLREDKNPADVRMPGNAARKPAKAAQSSTAQRKGKVQVAGVTLTNPDRVLYPRQALTKLDLARYYEEIADWILPQIGRRPLTLLRCPQGRSEQCFYQKHPGQAISADAPRIAIREKDGSSEDYLYVERIRDLVALVQAGTLELHAWGSTVEDVERPDILVFDLDPGPGVEWSDVLDAARSLQDRLRSLKLEAFLRTTGGKGLHVVVPIRPSIVWERAKAFCKAVAAAHAREDPKRFTTNMAKAKRNKRIFIDYLRNGRGSTAIVSYSTRAREGAPVAVPVRRDELKPSLRSDSYDVGSVRKRLSALDSDPWERLERSRRPLTAKHFTAVGLKDNDR